jgi:NTP pyrophosphatase (non-canonical NTP hydrolase)
MTLSMQQFADAMNEKMLLRARGVCKDCGGRGEPWAGQREKCSACNGTGHQNRSLEPWKDYSTEFLWSRLKDELKELDAATRPGEGITDEMADELLDVANFCAFLWLKWKMENSPAIYAVYKDSGLTQGVRGPTPEFLHCYNWIPRNADFTIDSAPYYLAKFPPVGGEIVGVWDGEHWALESELKAREGDG